MFNRERSNLSRVSGSRNTVSEQNGFRSEDKGKTTYKEKEKQGEDDDVNPRLASMETEIKPKVLKTVNTLTKEYNKVRKF